MFMFVVARPRLLQNGQMFDGKIGIWPFIKRVPAQRSSVNRARGTIEFKSITENADIFYEYMTHLDDGTTNWCDGISTQGVLEEIQIKCKHLRNEGGINVRIDGATPHTGMQTISKLNMYCSNFLPPGFDIHVLQSPAHMSVLDLCFNWSLMKRSDQLKIGAHTPKDLVDAVREAWDEYDWETLDGAWGCLISTYQRILNDEGGNEFKTPHNGVRRKQAMGVYVCDVPIDIAQIDRLELLIDAYFHVNP